MTYVPVPGNPNLKPGAVTGPTHPYAPPAGPHGPVTPTIEDIRKTLIQHGYNVSATGASNQRVTQAWMHFNATNGGGAKVWNAHNPFPGSVPFGGSPVPGAGHPGAPPAPHHTSPAHAAAPGAVPGYTPPADIGPLGGISGAGITQGMSPADQAAFIAKMTAQFAPVGGNSKVPKIDPAMYAAAMANTQFGPAISELQSTEAALQGAEPGAQANIAKYFAPVQAQAAAATTSDDAASAANVASQQGLAAKIAASLGLTGAAAGSLTSAGAGQSALAGNLATIMHQEDTAQQTNEANNEQQAHTTEASNNTNSLASARSQLLAQLAAKGSSQVAGVANAEQQNFQNQTQQIANDASRQNQKVVGAEAAQDLLSKNLANAGTTQNLQTNALSLPFKLGQYIDQHNLSRAQLTTTVQNIKQSNANIYRILHPVGSKPLANAFNDTHGADKDQLAANLHAMFHTAKGPNAAYKGMLDYLKNTQGFSGPKVALFAKSVVDKNWSKSNPNAHWDPKQKAYVNNSTGKPIN